MREAQIPSYRVRETAEDGGSRRLLMMAAGVLGTLAVGGVVGWTITHYTDNTIPVIQADSRPIKVRPEDRGGLRVANQDEIIFQRRTASGSYEPSGRLGPAAEAPNLDALRAATTPPAMLAPQVVAAPPPLLVPAPVQEAEPSATTLPIAAQTPPAAPPAAVPVPEPAPPVVVRAPEQLPPAAPPARPSVAVSGTVVVQLGALGSEAGARAEWDRLGRRVPELSGHAPQIIRFEQDGKPTMWRLRTGGFQSRDAASDLCNSVRSRGGACAVIGG
ncbi:SPOR domain-containing protein [Teichococcus vastitatis]|uniref:SPOR domain-containing protein n=1 Tax=Teichococcus vastitatis TaxID=2307076 RepID=A0ABS9W2A0_9PROT|nr:SPOR domain-containing protein [Pseudoroseomonas vastitatis]MCI0753427.1 SPOR domain-containing protein [Pseudoroseomonas vastitatis]